MTSEPPSLGEIAHEFQCRDGEGAVWEYILTQLPGLRSKALWDDVTDALADVAAKGTMRQMRAALEYLNLRYQFFEHLERTNRNMQHINQYEMETVQAYFARITSRMVSTTPGRVTKRRTWVPDKTPKKVQHVWLN